MVNQPNSASINISVNPYLSGLLLICSSLLLAIWPLPGTIALRHILLGLGFAVSLSILYGHRTILLQKSSWTVWLFFSFFILLLIHLLVFSHEFNAQLYELQHVWMRCFLAMAMGLALGSILTNGAAPNVSVRKNIVTLLLLIGLSGTCLIGFSHYGYSAWHTKQLLNYDVLFALYKAKPPFVIGAALALPLSFILIIRSINNQESRWWILPSLLIISLSLLIVYFSNTKNGIAIFAFTLAIFTANVFFKIQWGWSRCVLTTIIGVIIFSLSYSGIEKHIEKNSAWSFLISDFKVGMDIDYQNYWKNSNLYPPPLNAYGAPVNISTYERTAWFVAGSRLLGENPMGYGLLHHSFGSLALAKWPDFRKPVGNNRGSTHSGWLDFALGVGIPGLLLVLIPLCVAWYRSLFQEGLWFSYVAWTIPIMSFAYLTTEVAGAHFTELLFFMTAFFCGLTLRYPKSKHYSDCEVPQS
jgi:hypothetical protein